MTKNLVAVVPVRKGSQRVKNKNFKSFCGKNLLIHKIETLKKINQINEIIINTDSDEAIKIAKDLGVSFKKREEYYASSECSNSEFWSHIAEKTDSSLIMFTNCTSPLVKEETYTKIISTFEDSRSSNDSINTVTDIKEYLYLNNKPINFDPSKALKSQDLPEIVKLNFAVNILSREHMFKKKTVIGNKPLFYKLDDIEGIDIDTNYDFEFAEYLFNKFNRNKKI